MAYRLDQRRPLRRRQLITTSNSWLPERQRSNGDDIRRSSGNVFLQHSIQRTDTHQAGLRLRSRHTCKTEARVPSNSTLHRTKSNYDRCDRKDKEHRESTDKTPLDTIGRMPE